MYVSSSMHDIVEWLTRNALALRLPTAMQDWLDGEEVKGIFRTVDTSSLAGRSV
jgi:hypothetical protein